EPTCPIAGPTLFSSHPPLGQLSTIPLVIKFSCQATLWHGAIRPLQIRPHSQVQPKWTFARRKLARRRARRSVSFSVSSGRNHQRAETVSVVHLSRCQDFDPLAKRPPSWRSECS